MGAEDRESLFTRWLDGHGGAVLKVARAYTLTAEDRRDLVQEILLRVWTSLPGYRGEAGLSTWSYRVALNTALDWHGKEKRRRGRQRPIIEVEDPPDPGPDGPRQAARRELVERLYAAIRRLPPADAALVLLYLDDLSYREMAEVLGISESNVGVKLNRARKALGELLKEDSHGHK
ncbi:RNA polymerase sigma factor YlaC [Aquisphaera giovannonii]|uniref:RNA polymerase sigma factor YlaC n=1 Tax=Aquisphaera giovannonii TaxID=406548 RepID=A0A5B9WDS3_9BACT|nr:RNA polymerase sigma factor [Aquisphaera giovannonii]QEH38818.1 RNA polymerase sigma factor YlaC [Aquisphaera giovannonii]